MKRALISALVAVGLSFVSLSAQAQFTQFQVTNFTLSGGDPVFPITDDVTFTNLVLTEKFADNSTTTVPLFDPADTTHTPTNTLDTGVISLLSDTFAQPNAVHGALTSATLTGGFDLTNLNIQTSFGGSTTNVDVNPTFNATLSSFGIGDFVVINAIDAASGASYGAGTFGVVASNVPEPGAFAFLACGAGAFAFALRRRITRRG